MKLEDLGYNTSFERYRQEHQLENHEIGRVIAEHKERYIVKTVQGEYDAEISGNMRFTASGREDFPAVGDWVALISNGIDFAVIHAILPRYSIIKRQAIARFGEIQIIAANVDEAFLIQAVDRDFNINRLERYLTICHSSRIDPVIILSKIDLIDSSRLEEIQHSIHERISDIPVLFVSSQIQSGYRTVRDYMQPGKTYCMLGSSGVGKSTLLNHLAGRDIMRTGEISSSTLKGKHVTSHRELIILENGGILIDNPGMKEVGITDNAEGLEITFISIAQRSQQCKFKDCTHTHEAGCAILEAVQSGEIDSASYQNYLRMEREKAHFETTAAERRKKDKAFGKMLKNYQRDFKKDK
ncbi:MAG: ribosome small subunit-dependent GTPase A [Candidatus Delongbacteria bacterium]|nr:ribosome small subunit-dependent GTPase A [Candidatus Delongbacteria bacterium]